jgi:hypothetical protein
LRAAGITDLAAVAKAKGPDLARILSVSPDQAADFIRQARTLLGW